MTLVIAGFNVYGRLRASVPLPYLSEVDAAAALLERITAARTRSLRPQ